MNSCFKFLMKFFVVSGKNDIGFAICENKYDGWSGKFVKESVHFINFEKSIFFLNIFGKYMYPEVLCACRHHRST